ncbi:MAG: alpha/beta hydrolase [Chitinophagaceae bacterium]
MYKLVVIFIVTTCLALEVKSQVPARVRYKDPVFPSYVIQKNIRYQPQITNGRKKRYYKFDLYEPLGDTLKKRPLIIWIHGGGFKFGTKRSAGTPVWSKSFAQRGYVCAAVNYRLSKKRPLTRFKDMVSGCYDAVEDVLQAVAYFKQNRERYRIDTNRIILAGNSAGGITALQAVYSSFYDLAQLAGMPDTLTASHQYNPAGIKAVVSFWGAIFDTTWLQHARVPIVTIHGDRDKIVPIEHPPIPLYGSNPIHRQADSLHIPNRLKIVEGYGHELHKHFNPFWYGHKIKNRWLESGQFVAEFLYKQVSGR